MAYLGEVAFLILFPGFYVYHSLVNRGLVPGILGGYSTLVSLLLLPVLSVGYARRVIAGGGRMPGIDAAFLGFVAYLVLVSAAHLAAGANPEIALPYFGVAAQFAATFLAVRLMHPESVPARRALLASFLLVTALAFWNATDGSFLRSALDLIGHEARTVDYQGYGFVYLVLAVFVATATPSRMARAAAYLVSVPALFVNGARSEFVGLLLLIAIVELCYARRRAVVVGAAVTAVTFLLLAAGPLEELLMERVPESRFLALANVAADDNAAERIRMFWSAWETVRRHPFLGRFGSYPVGEYAHNALSAWVDLGLVGFLWFAVLLLVPLGILGSRFSSESRRPAYVLVLASVVVLVAMTAIAKNFTYLLLPIATGLFSHWINPGEAEERGRAPDPLEAGAGQGGVPGASGDS